MLLLMTVFFFVSFFISLYALDFNSEFPIVDQVYSKTALSACLQTRSHHAQGKIRTVNTAGNYWWKSSIGCRVQQVLLTTDSPNWTGMLAQTVLERF